MLLLDEAPIFGDIRTFLSEGYAESYQGLVDVVTAGFPCQAWSTAARGENKSSHDLWPETAEVIHVIKPSSVLLENVSKKAIERASADLYEMGYYCRGAALSAEKLGAPHPPTTKANYSANSMRKWPCAMNFIRVFGEPTPKNQEWMMGFPAKWTDTEPLEMGKFQVWLEQHGIS